jgi:hypothetical protein
LSERSIHRLAALVFAQRCIPYGSPLAGIIAAPIVADVSYFTLGCVAHKKTDLKTGLTPPATHFNPYRAFVIGTDGLAIPMHSIVTGYDEALEKATRLHGALRIKLWCGTRKVADVPSTA